MISLSVYKAAQFYMMIDWLIVRSKIEVSNHSIQKEPKGKQRQVSQNPSNSFQKWYKTNTFFDYFLSYKKMGDNGTEQYKCNL